MNREPQTYHATPLNFIGREPHRILWPLITTNLCKPVHTLLLIGAGGAIGALLRYFLSSFAHWMLGETFPWGTLLVNVLGCFLIGFLWAFFDRAPLSSARHAFVLTGVLGAFTTFSTYGLESISLIRHGEFMLAVGYILASNVVGLGAVIVGFLLARGFAGTGVVP